MTPHSTKGEYGNISSSPQRSPSPKSPRISPKNKARDLSDITAPFFEPSEISQSNENFEELYREVANWSPQASSPSMPIIPHIDSAYDTTHDENNQAQESNFKENSEEFYISSPNHHTPHIEHLTSIETYGIGRLPSLILPPYGGYQQGETSHPTTTALPLELQHIYENWSKKPIISPHTEISPINPDYQCNNLKNDDIFFETDFQDNNITTAEEIGNTQSHKRQKAILKNDLISYCQERGIQTESSHQTEHISDDEKYKALMDKNLPKPCKFELSGKKMAGELVFVTRRFTSQNAWSLKAGFTSTRLKDAKPNSGLSKDAILSFMLADWLEAANIPRNVNRKRERNKDLYIPTDTDNLCKILSNKENEDINKEITDYVRVMQDEMKKLNVCFNGFSI